MILYFAADSYMQVSSLLTTKQPKSTTLRVVQYFIWCLHWGVVFINVDGYQNLKAWKEALYLSSEYITFLLCAWFCNWGYYWWSLTRYLSNCMLFKTLSYPLKWVSGPMIYNRSFEHDYVKHNFKAHFQPVAIWVRNGSIFFSLDWVIFRLYDQIYFKRKNSITKLVNQGSLFTCSYFYFVYKILHFYGSCTIQTVRT